MSLIKKQLTKAQRKAIKTLLPEGNFAILHKRNNRYCYRVFTPDRVPILNVREGVFLKIKGWYTETKILDEYIIAHVLNEEARKLKFRNRKK